MRISDGTDSIYVEPGFYRKETVRDGLAGWELRDNPFDLQWVDRNGEARKVTPRKAIKLYRSGYKNRR